MAEQTPLVCQNCAKWDKFGRSCWVYWELKKHCTHHTTDWNDAVQ